MPMGIVPPTHRQIGAEINLSSQITQSLVSKKRSTVSRKSEVRLPRDSYMFTFPHLLQYWGAIPPAVRNSLGSLTSGV